MIEDALDLDVTDAVKKANDEKHFFLARGWNFVAALFGDQEIQAKPSLKDKKLLYTAVKQSELNKCSICGFNIDLIIDQIKIYISICNRCQL